MFQEPRGGTCYRELRLQPVPEKRCVIMGGMFVLELVRNGF